MRITRSPRHVHYILPPDKITSWLKLVADLAGTLGVLDSLERCTVKKRRRGIPASDFVMSLAYNFIVGGSHPSDIEELRNEIVEAPLTRRLAFSVTAKRTSALRPAIERVPKRAWRRHPWEEGTEWTEIAYRPMDWPRAFRMIVKRTPYCEGAQRVIGEFFYASVITNRRGAGSSIIRHRLARDWAWLVIARLAYNLAQWFKLLALPACEHHHQLRRLRLPWFCVVARFIRSTRRITVALARGPDRFALAQHRIAAL